MLPSSGGTVSFKYDAFGRRAQKSFVQGSTTTTTNYLYDGPNLFEELDGSGNLLGRYEQGPGIDEPLAELRSGTTTYYQADGLGSVTTLSDGSGAIASTYNYDSFGNITASTGTAVNPFRYTGREIDTETGLYYYRARYYAPAVGRFLEEDPIQFDGGPNFYSYVHNSPINNIDPLGEQSSGIGIPHSDTPEPGYKPAYNCQAWALGFTDRWVAPQSPIGLPNDLMPQYGCKKVPCDRTTKCGHGHRVNVYEDSARPWNWHVERQDCSGFWSSKNGHWYLFIVITDPDDFYVRSYHPIGRVVKTCWNCPGK